jgi:membrane associated rhomboid family serine protease
VSLARFQQVLRRLVPPGGGGEGLLVSVDPAEAHVFFAPARRVVVVRADGEHGAGMAERLRAAVVQNPKQHLTLVAVGGAPAEVRPVLRALRPAWMLRRTIETAHVADDGDVWMEAAGWAPFSRSAAARAIAALRGAPAEPEMPEVEARAWLAGAWERRHERLAELEGFSAALRRGRIWWTAGLAAAIAVVFVLQLWWGSTELVPMLVRLGANAALKLRAGEWWRLGASTFLHAGPVHFGMNVMVLFVLGGFLERLLGGPRLLALYGLSGLAGSVASALLSSAPLSVGASGALWGMLGASAGLAVRPSGLVPAALLPHLRRRAFVNLGLNVAVSLLPQVDLWAHLGGGVAGFAMVASGVLTAGLLPATPPVAAAAEAGATASAAPVEGGRRERAWERIWMGAAALLGLWLAASMGTALWKGKPWEMARPVVYAPHALAEPGLSIDVPTLLRAEEREHGADGADEVAYGDLMSDPLVIAVRVAPPVKPPLTAATFPAALDELRASARLFQPEGAEPAGDLLDVTIGGYPGLERRWVYPRSGFKHTRWLLLRPRGVLTVEVFEWNDAPASFADAPRHVVESLSGG